jgi:hypothetical protein
MEALSCPKRLLAATIQHCCNSGEQVRDIPEVPGVNRGLDSNSYGIFRDFTVPLDIAEIVPEVGHVGWETRTILLDGRNSWRAVVSAVLHLRIS